MADRRLKSINKQSKPALKKCPRMAVRDIASLKGISKTEAVLEYVKEQRVLPKIDHLDEKTNIPRSDMPWSPDLKNLIRFPPGSVSCLNGADHRRYVAIITNFLQPKPSFRFEMNRMELQGLDQQLSSERQLFEESVRSYILHFKNSPFNVGVAGSVALFCHRQRGKITEAFGNFAFRDEVARVLWPHSADEDVQTATYRLKRTQTFSEGRMNKIRFPDVRRRCQYFMNDRVIDDYFTAEAADKAMLIDDQNALELALSNDVEYVLDASTLRQLLVDKWEFRNQSFCYRLSVVRRVRNGTTHRVCFFSKPILASQMDLLHVHRQFVKWSVKAEIKRAVQSQRNAAKPTKTVTADSVSHLADTSADMVKAIGNAAAQTASGNGSVTINDTNDLLGGILGGMSMFAPQIPASEIKTESKIESIGDNAFNVLSSSSISSTAFFEESVHPTSQKRYRYETVSLTANDSRFLLVRTSNHGIDHEGKPISFTVKNEYVPEAGAQVKSDEEILWNCVTATLKDATEHVNLHMYPRNGHCLQMQRYEPARHFSEMNISLKQKLWTRVRRVCELLNHLDKLEIGEYLIMQDGESLRIIQEHEPSMLSVDAADEGENDMETESSSPSILNADAIIAACKFNKPPCVVSNTTELWAGVDAHLPLVWQIVQGRIPGSLLPPGHKLHKLMTVNPVVTKGPLTSDGKLSKSQKRRLRKGGKNAPSKIQKKAKKFAPPNPASLVQPAETDPAVITSSAGVSVTKDAHETSNNLKPGLKRSADNHDAAASAQSSNAKIIRRFKRPGEKPPKSASEVTAVGGREKIKYENPFD